MNMKKTIAAIAACAVAVSAMATTVSAEEGSLHYNLVKTTYKTEGTATYTATISNLDTTGAANVVITAQGMDASVNLGYGAATYTITGYNYDQANGSKSDAFSFVVTSKAATWSLNRSDWVSEDGTTITIPVATTAAAGIVAGNTYITVSAAVKHSNTGWTDALNNGAHFDVTAGAVTEHMATTLTAYAGASGAVDKQYPMKTTLNGVTGTTEIVTYLENKANNLVKDGMSYVNVRAVINDVIANYDDVTFTFNTATNKVNNNGEYDGNGAIDCTAFGQHLYNLYGDETTGYVYTSAYDWSYYNLFSGALIINDGLSMSLNDTNTFDYGKSSISFNWADVTDGATVNTYVTYLHSMRLATSTDWYWDSMDVVFANTEAEDTTVDSDASAEVEDDEIPEEEVPAEEEEAPAEEEEAPAEEEEAPAEEETPVAETTNPGTGNAPIALAVIPVALAAAAVVAKKRG